MHTMMCNSRPMIKDLQEKNNLFLFIRYFLKDFLYNSYKKDIFSLFEFVVDCNS